MELIVKRFQEYVASYNKQILYKEYSDETLIDDMLYGLGLAFDKKFVFGNGYRDWKEVLVKYLETGKLTLTKRVAKEGGKK